MTGPIRLAVVGMGKIARDHHLPAIAADPRFVLAATVSRQGTDAVAAPTFADLDSLAASGLPVDAVALCTPPQVRRALAMRALAQGWHVFLEKPPAASLSEVELMVRAAEASSLSLFASWHSRFASGVASARAWLAGRDLRHVSVAWREDVRRWHPGQDWLWEPGGFGVFDPGINALSILTYLLDEALFVESATLDFPENRAAPIAGRATLRTHEGLVVEADFDFRQEGRQQWDIVVGTDEGNLVLGDGGGRLELPGASGEQAGEDLAGEYPGLYARFAELVSSSRSEVDVRPLRLVADIFMRGRRETVAPYIE